MTREEALHWLDTIPTIGEQVDALEMAIKALEQEPKTDGDCISRQATLKPYDGLKDDDVIAVWLIRKNIEQQKTVKPQEPKTGHWIMHDKHRECSVCNVWMLKYMPRNSYCPNCGAKMSETEGKE